MKDMTTGSPTKLIIAFSVPMLIGNFFQQVYNFVDAMVVGKFIGSDALAAVGTGGPIMFLAMALIMGLAMGAGILISQLYGAKRMDDIKRATSSVVIALFIMTVIISVLGYFLAPFLLQKVLAVPEQIYKDSLIYTRVFFVGLIGMFLYNMISALLRAVGDSKTPTYFIGIATVINIVLDIYFVAKLHWGIAGVAWATLIAQAFSGVALLIYIYKKVPLFALKKKEFVFDGELMLTALKLAIPSSLQQVFVALGFVVFQRLINSFGETVIAGVTAAARVDQLAVIPLMTIGMALATFAAQNVGAGDIERAKKGYWRTILISLACCVFLSATILIFGRMIISKFIPNNPEAVAIGTQYIIVVGCFYLLFSIMNSSNSFIRGVGDVTFSTIITIVAFGSRIILAYSLKEPFGYSVIWWSMPIGWFISAIMGQVRYFSGAWTKKAVVGKNAMGAAILNE